MAQETSSDHPRASPRPRPWDPGGSKRLRARVWSAGRVLLLFAALGLTFSVFFLAAVRVASRSRDVTVPDLRGRSVADAGTMLAENGLAMRLDAVRRPDPKVPADHVIGQDPEPGTIVRRSRPVRLRVSDGARSPVVPAVVGLSERAAAIALGQEQVDVTSTAEIRTTEYAPGAVVAQDPLPKSRSATVRLLVNRADRGATYVMPDLIGTYGGRAADVLRKAGFFVTMEGDTPYPGLPAGIVIRQSPQSGFQVARGEPIKLETSR